MRCAPAFRSNSGLRYGSAAAGLYLFLFLLFALIAIVALSLGISLESIDRWIEANGGWIEALGDLLFRAIWAVVFVLSALTCGSILFGAVSRLCAVRLMTNSRRWTRRRIEPANNPGALSLGCGFLVALALGYFTWFGMTGSKTPKFPWLFRHN